MSPNDPTEHVVTAVLVAHDGARWIPVVARALHDQTCAVHRVVAVDTGSRDRSGNLLARVLGGAAVFGADRGTGFGAAVAQALRHRAANIPLPAAGRETVEWVWLLHDDCAPAPDALERLLAAAHRAPQVAVLGPKVRDWEDRRVITEVGIAIDGSGRRETGLEPNELDQGQHDGERDVLAVGSCAMLIRRDVWDRLGGFDSSLQMFRDDIDFCWRAVAAGYRVRLVTDAVVYHVAAAERRLRPLSVPAAVGGRTRRLDRRNALYVLFTSLPLHAMLVSVARNVIGSLLRTVILVGSKHPAAAWDELAALASVLSDPLGLLRGRRRRAPGRRRCYPVVRSFIPRGQTVGRLTEIIGSALAGSAEAAPTGAEEEEALLTDTGFAQRIMTHPGVLTIVALTVIALTAERSLLHGGWLGGGALVPVNGGAGGLWREYLAAYHDAGLGSAASAPPYVAVLAAASTLAAGKPWFAIDVLLLGCVPLAGITAYLAARRITTQTFARIWAACSYALLPVATGAIAAGRLGTAIAFVLIPVIGILADRMLTMRGRRGRQSAWAAGLVVTVAAAFVPLIWALSVIAAVLAYLAFGRGRRQMVINFGIVALVPAVLLVPWTLDIFRHPSLFVLEVGLQRPDLASPALPASSLLLLSPGGPGLPPVWVTAGFGLAGLVAILVRRHRVLVAAGWGVALAGLLTAITVSRITVVAPGGTAVPGWPGVALIFAAAGVLLAALTGGESLAALLRAGGIRRMGGVAVALAASSAPVLVAGTWVLSGVHGPLASTGGTLLPEFVTASAANGMRTRTLLLRTEPRPIRYTVLRNADPLVGEQELAEPPSARRALDTVVAGLATGNGGDLGDDGSALSQFAIGYVLVRAPIDPGFVRVLDGTPGLRPVSLTGSFGLWQVTGTAARVRVIEPDGNVVAVRSGRVTVAGAQVPAAGGTLVLAEPAGSGWHASLNGRALTPLPRPVGGWAQGFSLPAGGGRLNIGHSALGRQAALVAEALAVVVAVVFALPSAGAEETVDAEPTPPGAVPSRRRSRHKPTRAKPSRRGRGTRVAPPAPPPARPVVPEPARAAVPRATRRRSPGSAAAREALHPPGGGHGPDAAGRHR